MFFACSTDEQTTSSTLQSLIAGQEVVLDNVIACAANNVEDGLVSVFLYPREGVTNIQYFETDTYDLDKNDLSKYTRLNAPLVDAFGGTLLKFQTSAVSERWGIVSFEEAGKIHLSNPIRLKQQTKPTEYLQENVSIDQSLEGMPVFSWEDGIYEDTKIYFQVVSDAAENLLSGTYTFERNFQYYKLENVVLNITDGEPAELQKGASYRFTLLAVSEDNWVNLFSEIAFFSQ